jgi:hypothetical protein
MRTEFRDAARRVRDARHRFVGERNRETDRAQGLNDTINPVVHATHR